MSASISLGVAISKRHKEIINEISNRVMLVQNVGSGEFKMRDVDDRINKLLREKRHWDQRIIELGDRDLMLRPTAKSAFGSENDKYFVAAKDLPVV